MLSISYSHLTEDLERWKEHVVNYIGKCHVEVRESMSKPAIHIIYKQGKVKSPLFTTLDFGLVANKLTRFIMFWQPTERGLITKPFTTERRPFHCISLRIFVVESQRKCETTTAL